MEKSNDVYQMNDDYACYKKTYLEYEILGRVPDSIDMIIEKYFELLLRLNNEMNKLEVSSKLKAVKDNRITFYIIEKIFKNIKYATINDDIGMQIRNRILLTKELKRLQEYIEYVQSSKNYNLKYDQIDIMKLVSEYMNEEEIKNILDIIFSYPKDKTDYNKNFIEYLKKESYEQIDRKAI